jgi:hypothetical protein
VAATDSGAANIRLVSRTTSALGGMADGVLGCSLDTGEATIIRGWNWYDGTGAAGIGAGQYDFQTVVTHELGHVLGLGHSSDADSVMFATLATGAVRRTMVTQDLNIPDTDNGPSGLHAALMTGAGAVGDLPGVRSVLPPPGEPELIGGTGRDLLLAGWIDNADDTALRLVLAERTAKRVDLTGIPNLDSTDGGQVRRGTAHDDGTADLLTGSAGQDWFLLPANGESGHPKDRAAGLRPHKFAGDLDFRDLG